MEGYSVKIVESSRELTAKERIQLKDLSTAKALDEVIESNERIVISPEDYVVLEVHNEKSDTKDYEKYVIIDKDGTKYSTGSQPLWSTYQNIADEMEGESEDWSIVVFSLPSKNYKGKSFLTCEII